MLLMRLWNYIRGYVIIIVEGYFLEKFMNICIHRQIFLWDVKRPKNSTMTLKMSIKGFKLLPPIAKKTGCRVRIKDKLGLPFVLHRYKKRKFFLLGAIIFVAVVYFMTSFVWVIEISGNKKVQSQIIIDKLSSYGVHAGTLKYGINTDEMINKMMLDIKELAWVSIVLKGTKIKVTVVERVKAPEFVPKGTPCNIVAYRDGVIKSVVAKTGQQAVKTGDTVVKGDVLISGTIISENKVVVPKQVHVIGNVLARTWYEKTCPVSTTIMEKVKTGKTKNKYSLVLFSKLIKLFSKKEPFESYEKKEINKNLSLGGDLQLPFGVVIDRYYEEKTVERKLDIGEARKIASDKAYQEAAADIPEDAEIISTKVNFIQDEDGNLVADVIIECVEDIGIPEPIGGE